MNKESLWRTLFLMLLTANLTLLFGRMTDYSGLFGPLNSALVEEFESALQDDPQTRAGFRGTTQDAVNQLQGLKPPFWKKAKHLEYTALATQLRGMEYQVQQPTTVSTDTWKASYTRMPNVKQADVDRMLKSMLENVDRQKKAREHLLPKFTEKLERFKSLGKSLS